jgi:hypothetical protein
MGKKPDPLSDLLAKSFSAAPKPAEANSQPSAVDQNKLSLPQGEGVPEQLNQQGREEKPTTLSKSSHTSISILPENQTPLPDFEGVKKTTVSFYATEQAHVDEILDLLLKGRRHRGGFSDAVKIALRLCPKNPEDIGRAWDSARAEDKRTQKGKS